MSTRAAANRNRSSRPQLAYDGPLAPRTVRPLRSVRASNEWEFLSSRASRAHANDDTPEVLAEGVLASAASTSQRTGLLDVDLLEDERPNPMDGIGMARRRSDDRDEGEEWDANH